MAMTEEGGRGLSASARVRAEIGHPIIDTDGHMVEFGCEADDRGVATAFAPTNPHGSRLGAMFSSDIGHWDVHDPAEVVAECYELLVDGVLTAERFRAFTFGNAARLYTRANPNFFSGTAIASTVAAIVGETVAG